MVVFGIFLTAHTLFDAVSANNRLIPFYNPDKDTNEVKAIFDAGHEPGNQSIRITICHQ